MTNNSRIDFINLRNKNVLLRLNDDVFNSINDSRQNTLITQLSDYDVNFNIDANFNNIVDENDNHQNVAFDNSLFINENPRLASLIHIQRFRFLNSMLKNN